MSKQSENKKNMAPAMREIGQRGKTPPPETTDVARRAETLQGKTPYVVLRNLDRNGRRRLLKKLRKEDPDMHAEFAAAAARLKRDLREG